MSTAPEPGSGTDRLGPTVAAGVLAFLLGFVGLGLSLGAWPVFNLGYRALQLFVLDGGALDGIDEANIHPVLQLARFAAPAVTIAAVVVGLRAQFAEDARRREIARTAGHTVVCGDDAAALTLAENLRKRGRAVVLVAPSAMRTRPGIPIVVGDPVHPATLEAAGVRGAAALYALANRSATNAEVALAAGSLRSEPLVDNRRWRPARFRAAPPPDFPLATYAQVRSDELVEQWRARRLADLRMHAQTLDFFTVDEIGARLLLDQHPLGGRTPVVVGFGPLGKAVLRAIVRRPGAAANAQVIVSASDLAGIRSEAHRLGAAHHGWTVRHGRPVDGDGPIFVCLEDQDEAVATGLRLAREVEHTDRTVVACLRRRSPFGDALGEVNRLEVFGVLDEACAEDAIHDASVTMRTARAVHERYLAEARRRGDRDNPSAVEWELLPEDKRESNRAQAEQIGAALAGIRAYLVTRRPARAFDFTEAETEALAAAEHARWVAREHTKPTVDPDDPDLLDWSALAPDGRAKDIAAVRSWPSILGAEGIYIARIDG